MAEGLSGLETPSYVYAMVLAFFLIMSLIIEKVVEFVEHCFDRFGRKGLKSALNSIIREVMMLGFISLVLTVIEDPISEICVNKFTNYGHWIRIEHIEPCNTCLEHTRGLSAEYKAKYDCPFWDNDSHHEPAHDDAHPADAHDDEHHSDEGHHRRRLLASGGHGHECEEGKEVLVSVALLHEVHLAIFLLTVMHIANVIFMVILANFRVNRWRRWKLEDDKEELCISASCFKVTLMPKPGSSGGGEPTAVVVDPKEDTPPPPSKSAFEVPPNGNQPAQTAAAESEDTASAGKQPRSQSAPAGSKQPTPKPQKSAADDANVTTDKSGTTLRILRHASELPDDDNTASMILRWQTEWFISFFKQFIRPVTQNEFRIMRAAFMVEHRRSTNFDFMEYLTRALDDDVCEVVKISTTGWVTLIVIQVLYAPVKYTGWVFLGVAIVFVMLVLIVCAKLITVVRHVTRGGRVNKLEPSVFWFEEPKKLLPVVRYTLFINSAIFAVMATFAIQYGARSCAFYGHEGDDSLHFSAWLIILFINLGSFLHISFIMLPTYSLVVHMGSTHWSHHLLNDNIKDKLLNLRKRVAQDKPTGGHDGERPKP